jgi:hypothetical protein
VKEKKGQNGKISKTPLRNHVLSILAIAQLRGITMLPVQRNLPTDMFLRRPLCSSKYVEPKEAGGEDQAAIQFDTVEASCATHPEIQHSLQLFSVKKHLTRNTAEDM